MSAQKKNPLPEVSLLYHFANFLSIGKGKYFAQIILILLYIISVFVSILLTGHTFLSIIIRGACTKFNYSEKGGNVMDAGGSNGLSAGRSMLKRIGGFHAFLGIY
jgi:hypothetical protein